MENSRKHTKTVEKNFRNFIIASLVKMFALAVAYLIYDVFNGSTPINDVWFFAAIATALVVQGVISFIIWGEREGI